MPALVNLCAIGDTPSTRIAVRDGAFAEVAGGQGIGRVEVQVPPGLYQLTFGTISQAVNRIVDVPADSTEPITVRVTAEDLQIASAAPLHGSALTPPYQRQAARLLSRNKPQRLGRGSWLFLFIRDVLGVAADYVSDGTTLHDADGRCVADITEQCEADRQAAYAGLHLELTPGLYRLRIQTGSVGALEQSIVTCRHWQTQVFLLCTSYGPRADDRRPDLGRASILMAGGVPATEPPEFDPDQEQAIHLGATTWSGKGQALRWAELACQELAGGRQGLPRQFYEDLLYAKYNNPMFGICGAHLLLRELDREGKRDPAGTDFQLFAGAVQRLHEMLGPHPDVLALATLLPGTPIKVRSFRYPPMLRSSWQCVLQASSAPRQARLLPADALAAQVSTRLWGSGCWLVWQAPPTNARTSTRLDVQLPSAEAGASPQVGTPAQSAAELWHMFTRLVQHWGPHDAPHALRWAARVAAEQNLTPLEHLLLDYLVQLGVWNLLEYVQQPEDLAEAEASPARAQLEWPVLVERFQVPLAVIQDTVRGLTAKLAAVAPEPPTVAVWPPANAAEYLASEDFSQLLLTLALGQMQHHPHQDFSDAAAQVFAWLDEKVQADPTFLNAERFPTVRAFAVYLRRALLNAAHLTQRRRQADAAVDLLDLDQSLSATEPSPEQVLELLRAVEQLPLPQREVVEALIFEEQDLHDLAQRTGRSERDLTRDLELALETLGTSAADAEPGPGEAPA